jgi:TPR repeat protein
MPSFSKKIRYLTLAPIVSIALSLLACTEKPEPINKTVTIVTSVSQDKITQLQREAQEGDPDAQYNLAYLYENGLGLPKDEAKALELYQKAADQGHSDASNSLDAMRSSK